MSLVLTSIPIPLLSIPILPVFTVAAGISALGMTERESNYQMSSSALNNILKNAVNINCKTNLQNTNEVIEILEKTLYTVTLHSPREITTYIPNSEIYAIWKMGINGYEVNFRSMDSKKSVKHEKIIEEYMKNINAIAGKDVFGLTTKDGELPVYSYETAFKDKYILLKTIEEHGAENIEIKDDNVNCVIENIKFEFTKNENDTYVVLTYYNGSKEDLVNTMSNLNNEYCQNVQEKTYETIKQKAQEENMEIESEEILEDNSILLTINLD
ncbi:MAG: hypothetical protein E7Z91_04155 [Cyanobacteria bacterium SIG30]|nr:hypothetical protein [Cyanobacteria bacterium SIG30]